MSTGSKMKKGSILITTLWILAILSLFAMGIGFRASLEVRLSRYAMDKLQARYLAKSGIVKARELFLKSPTVDADTMYMCGILFDGQETPESVFGSEENSYAGGNFSVHYIQEEGIQDDVKQYFGILDEDRKININKYFSADPLEFGRVLKGLSTDISDLIISAIVDWRDEYAEDEFDYELEYGYKRKDGDFDSIEELMLVQQGMTREIFESIKPYITVHSNDEGKVNINTASRKVLSAVLGDNYGELIEAIIQYRKGLDGEAGTKDDQAITDIGVFSGIPGDERLTAVADSFGFKSSGFRILSHGHYRKIDKHITCVIKKGEEEEAEVLYYHEE